MRGFGDGPGSTSKEAGMRRIYGTETSAKSGMGLLAPLICSP
jgi:hypothetical protein